MNKLMSPMSISSLSIININFEDIVFKGTPLLAISFAKVIAIISNHLRFYTMHGVIT